MSTQRRKRRTASEKPILQLRVKGPGVRSGRVPIPDLVKICEEAQKTINRQAEAMEGKKTLHPGPISDAIRQECTLELIGIKRGSTRLQFGLAKPQAPLPFPDQATFGALVVGQVALTIKNLGNGHGPSKEVDAGVLQGLYELGAVTENKRVSEIEWISPKAGDLKRIAAPVNRTVRERVAERMSSPKRVQMQIDGILDMADFKPTDLKCRIDPAIGSSVVCTFDEREINQVQSLLRKPVRAVGMAVIAPYTNRIESFHIQKIERLPSLSLGEGNFFAESSISELAAKQKVKPLKDVSVLCGGFPDDENIDTFLEDIYNARK
jgi:hypothetical protein